MGLAKFSAFVGFWQPVCLGTLSLPRDFHLGTRFFMAKSRQKKHRTMESSDLVDENQESLEATTSASKKCQKRRCHRRSRSHVLDADGPNSLVESRRGSPAATKIDRLVCISKHHAGNRFHAPRGHGCLAKSSRRPIATGSDH